MASRDSSWAQARALGFSASDSGRVGIKRVLILLLGPASKSSETELSKPEKDETQEQQKITDNGQLRKKGMHMRTMGSNMLY